MRTSISSYANKMGDPKTRRDKDKDSQKNHDKSERRGSKHNSDESSKTRDHGGGSNKKASSTGSANSGHKDGNFGESEPPLLVQIHDKVSVFTQLFLSDFNRGCLVMIVLDV